MKPIIQLYYIMLYLTFLIMYHIYVYILYTSYRFLFS